MTAFALLSVLLLAAEDTSGYTWPLDQPRVLTSSFAEYREGRFHMGIDLRTGPSGKTVYAAGAGHVSRVLCSPYGYGKAVYLELDDGNTIVYAHLSDFAPALREHVRTAQHRREQYSVNLYPERNQFRVEAGEVIGKSGQTGIGVPHLHFEIRDASGAPINPRKLGVSWPDTSAPEFRKLLILPLKPESRIDGDMLPVVREARPRDGGGYTVDPIALDGPVAFGVDVVDYANGRSSRLGVHTLALVDDENPIVTLKHDRVTYDNHTDGIVSYNPFFLDRGRFLMLWRSRTNDAELYVDGDGAFAAPAGPSQLRLIAVDFLGNAAILSIPIRSSATDRVVDPSENDVAVSLDYFGAWLVVSARFQNAESQVPRLVAGSDQAISRPFTRIDDTTFRVQYLPEHGTGVVSLRVEHPNIDVDEFLLLLQQRGEPVTSLRLGGLTIDSSANTPYDTLALRVESVDAPSAEDLTPIGGAYRLWHPDAPIDEPIAITFPEASDVAVDKIGVYRLDGDEWELLDAERTSAGLRLSTRQLGVFRVMRDDIKPRIAKIEPSEGTNSYDTRPAIHAVITDLGSGIDTFEARFNGQWLLMAYDPERDLLEWEQDEDLPLGEGSLEFRATDAAGNTRARTVTIRVR